MAAYRLGPGVRALGWSLYQAATHASIKRMSPQRAAEAYGPLNEVLVGAN